MEGLIPGRKATAWTRLEGRIDGIHLVRFHRAAVIDTITATRHNGNAEHRDGNLIAICKYTHRLSIVAAYGTRKNGGPLSP